jgi:hypothetical protein
MVWLGVGVGLYMINARGLRVPHRAGTVDAQKLIECLGLGSSLRYRVRSRAPSTSGQARWPSYICTEERFCGCKLCDSYFDGVTHADA